MSSSPLSAESSERAHASGSDVDRHSRLAALALSLALPGDVVLYLLLPMYSQQFGVTLTEAGLLLAANRLIRIVGYGFVARFYAKHGDRAACTFAVAGAAVCAVGYATLSGFWWLLPLRLIWGLSFAALNLSTQALATADAVGAGRRSGRSKAFIAIGPVVALPGAALLTYWSGPHLVFWILAIVAITGLSVARFLPDQPHAMHSEPRRMKLPNSLDAWSFMEGLTLDGLFVIGLSYLGSELMPAGAVMMVATLMTVRYLGEILLSPVGGRLAERFGAERLLIVLSIATAIALIGFGYGLLWSCAGAIVVLRALQLPLIAPIVAHRTPGPQRVRALASRSVWRDIGAGTGPLLAGFLLPIAAPIWLYGVSASLLALCAIATEWDKPQEHINY